MVQAKILQQGAPSSFKELGAVTQLGWREDKDEWLQLSGKWNAVLRSWQGYL